MVRRKGVFGRLKDKFLGKTLYFPGCTTRHIDRTYNKTIESNYKSILKKLDIEFTTLNIDFCCGSKLFELGHKDSFDEHVKQKHKLLKKFNISKIITNCPHCAVVFKEEYGLETEFLLDIISKRQQEFNSPTNIPEEKKEISYHDPCIVARQLKLKEGPRKLLEGKGYKMKEMENNKELTLCCGAGGSLRYADFFLSKKVAEVRLNQCKTEDMVVSCPLCYHHFKDISKSKNIIEISEELL